MTNIKKNNCGRPAGRIKTAKIEIKIEPTVKDEFMRLLRKEGKTWVGRIDECCITLQRTWRT